MLDSKSRQSSVVADISVQPARPNVLALQGPGTKTFFRPRDAAELGIDSRMLRRLVDAGSDKPVVMGGESAIERLGLRRGQHHEFRVRSLCEAMGSAVARPTSISILPIMAVIHRSPDSECAGHLQSRPASPGLEAPEFPTESRNLLRKERDPQKVAKLQARGLHRG